MARDSVGPAHPEALLSWGVLRERIGKIKREALDDAMGKGESWTTKVVNGEMGVKLDDMPRFVDALGLKLVDKSKRCVDPELAEAYEVIVRRATQSRSLLFDDAE